MKLTVYHVLAFVAILALLSLALTAPGQPIRVPKPGECYGWDIPAMMGGMLWTVAIFSYLAGREDGRK